MFLRIDDWEAIRGEFTVAEKEQLNAAITGEVLCPRGAVIDEVLAGTTGTKAKNLIARLRAKTKGLAAFGG